MTSLRSRPRPSSGSSVAAAALAIPFFLGVAGAAGPPHAEGSPLEETRGGVTVDWQAGTLRASGGAAADLRMPSVDLARPGALRRANAAAAAKLRAALGDLPLGGGKRLASAEIERALGRARTIDTQVQSNGGAVVRAEIRFGDWLEPPGAGAPPPASGVTLAVSAMRLGAGPPARIGGRDLRIGAAVYRVGPTPAGAAALAAHVDEAGRLVLAPGAGLDDKLARGLTVIYVQKVLR